MKLIHYKKLKTFHNIILINVQNVVKKSLRYFVPFHLRLLFSKQKLREKEREREREGERERERER